MIFFKPIAMKKTLLLLLTLFASSLIFAQTDTTTVVSSDSTFFPTDTTSFPTDTTTWNPSDTTVWNPIDTTTWNPNDTTSFPTDTTTWNPSDTTSFPSDTTTWVPQDTATYVYIDSLLKTAQTIYGCTDINALNFDVNANKNNGSCTYSGIPTVAYGCTDQSALNYNSKATINEGCIYEQKSVITLPKEIVNKTIELPETKTILEAASACGVDFGKLIDSVSIDKVELISGTTYKVFWKIYQGGTNVVVTQESMFDVIKSYIVVTNITCIPTTTTFRTLSSTPTIEIASLLRTDVLTAANDVNTANSFTVFPNPATDEVYVEGNLTNKSVKVLSMNGSVVKEVTTPRIDISNLASGVYFIQCEINNNIVIKKIIKN